ncbi:MAG: hypothetical protein QW808_01780 [Desulfurococcaceae archaeon]
MKLRGIISAILLSIFRKGAYKVLIAAFAPPLLLSAVLLSVPSLTVFVDTVPQQSSVECIKLVVFNGRDSCFDLQIAGIARIGSVELPLVATPEDFLRSGLVDFKAVAENCDFISIPADVYEKHRGEYVVIGDVEKCVSHVHEGIYAVIQVGFMSVESRVKLCSATQADVFKRALAYVEESLRETSTAWLNTLFLAYIPMAYLAVMRVQRILSEEFTALINLGVSRGKLALGFTVASFTVSSLIAVFLLSLSAVALNALHKLISLYWPALPLLLQTSIAFAVIEVLCISLLVSIVISLREVRGVKLL